MDSKPSLAAGHALVCDAAARRSAAGADAHAASVAIAYRQTSPAAALAEADTLAVIAFGAAPRLTDPRYIAIGLESPFAADTIEVWQGTAPVITGNADSVRYAHDDNFLFGAIEVEERNYADLTIATTAAYRSLLAFTAKSGHGHVLRIWNYFDAINQGNGDAERYKQFCFGRAAGIEGAFDTAYPAATAIGRRNASGLLQIYWLAARKPGQPVENPRQVSAYRYPRQYGPAAPSFARATLVGTAASPQLLISGTASVVGHASHHADDLDRQIDETLANLDSLMAAAAGRSPTLPVRVGLGAVLKVYVRHAEQIAEVQRKLRTRLPAELPILVLVGDICRADLLIEIDGLQGLA